MFGFGKKDRNFFSVVVILSAILALMALNDKGVWGQGWPEMKIRLLPDNAFALVETDVGEKIRHCPHHDLNGSLDEEQLIFTLGTPDRETWVQAKNESVARQHLEKHYGRFRKRFLKKGIQKSVNINTASLTELVTLPQIGPVFAVRIVEYKDVHGMFMAVEDIQKVNGIGQGTFYAIRHYISVD